MTYYENPAYARAFSLDLSDREEKQCFSRVQAGTVSLSGIPGEASSYQKYMIMENISDLYYLGPPSREFPVT